MCDNKLTLDVNFGGELVEITVTCGDLYTDGHRTQTAQCPTCGAKAIANYPQGWRYYPGDVCKHGTYIGGDRDCACGKCEMGD